jgi:hypothetical protein
MEIETRVTSFSHIPDRRETLELEKILMTPQESWKTFIEERI